MWKRKKMRDLRVATPIATTKHQTTLAGGEPNVYQDTYKDVAKDMIEMAEFGL